MMKKETLYRTLIVLLLVLNVVQLGGHFFVPKPTLPVDTMGLPPQQGIDGTLPPPPSDNPSSRDKPQRLSFAQKVPGLLQLDDEQSQAFSRLAKQHASHIAKLTKQQNQLTERYFTQPSAELLDEIAEIDKQKVTLTESHFNKVFQLLTPEQQPNFTAFKQAALQIVIR